MRLSKKYWLLFMPALFQIACKQIYNPAPVRSGNHFLVVEGMINTLPDSKTTITLSRSRNFADTVLSIPEKGAEVRIEAKTGYAYLLQEQSGGVYSLDHLTIIPTEMYRLMIHTSNGSQYVSDFVPVKQSPPIDSLTWKQDNDVSVYVNTHDPQNNTWYYRWDYEETWSYHSILPTIWGVNNGLIFLRDSSNQIYECWRDAASTSIIIGTSLKLSQDVIDHYPITTISHDAEKLWVRYTILVKQYALTEDAYKYWQILQKNTQQLGSLFDPQPSQLKSNIHNINDPNDPVIGYASAGSVQEKRLFIRNSELFNWIQGISDRDCHEITISQNPNFLVYNYPDTSYSPYFFITGGGLQLAKNYCLDCRQLGGSNVKPAFW